jgi:MoxR-like ATPase
MQEHYVTVGGVSYELPSPFHVLATQNPIEQEGTYPLPEAQLDRFLLEINVPYPDLEAERRMLFATTGTDEEEPSNVFSRDELMRAQRLTRTIPVGEKVADAILQLVRSARPGPEASDYANETISWGPGPRASQSLMLGVRARALIDGRLSPSLDDVVALAAPVLRHRMAITFSARADGITIDDVINTLTEPIVA